MRLRIKSMDNGFRNIAVGFSVKFPRVVEKLWISLWGSLWESCGKVLHMAMGFVILCVKCGKVDVLHRMVEKFYARFTHTNNGGRNDVLHSFHIPYYYYY